MVNQVKSSELQLNEANTTDTEAPFIFYILYLYFIIANGFVSSKIYDKRDGCGYDNVNFPFFSQNTSFKNVIEFGAFCVPSIYFQVDK